MKDPEEYLRDCVRIVPEALVEEFVRIPADIAYWNEQYARSYQNWLECELYRKTLYAKRYTELGSLLSMGKTGARGATVGEIEAAVAQDPDYHAARVAEVEAEAVKVRLWGVMQALQAKREMLISIGAHQRLELQQDPMIRKRGYLDREVEENSKER